jgi:hypothetical protein
MEGTLQQKNAASHSEVDSERVTLLKNDAIKYIGDFISRYKEKPSSVVVEVVGFVPSHKEKPSPPLAGASLGVIRMSGYKDVTTISASDFLVHVYDKVYEQGFTANLAKDICIEAKRILKKKPKSFFDKELIQELIESKDSLKKMKGDEFTPLVVAFSALNEKEIHLAPSRTLPLRHESDSITASANDYLEQFNAVVLLNRLRDSGIAPGQAVRKVLETIRTDKLAKACKEYALEEEGKFASDWQSREARVKSAVLSFPDVWKDIDPYTKQDEFKANVGNIDADLCELALTRTILKYERSLAEDKKSIASLKIGIDSEEYELRKGQLQRDLVVDNAAYTQTKRWHSNLQKALEIIKKGI